MFLAGITRRRDELGQVVTILRRKEEFIFTYVSRNLPNAHAHTYVRNIYRCEEGSRERRMGEQNGVMLGVETKDGTSATP